MSLRHNLILAGQDHGFGRTYKCFDEKLTGRRASLLSLLVDIDDFTRADGRFIKLSPSLFKSVTTLKYPEDVRYYLNCLVKLDYVIKEEGVKDYYALNLKKIYEDFGIEGYVEE